MKLKRLRKVEYNEKGEAIIRIVEHHLYDYYFIDNDDWLCIDEDDYTPAKKAARDEERRKNLMKQYAEVDYTALPKPIGRVFFTSIQKPTIQTLIKMDAEAKVHIIDEMVTIQK